MAKILAPNEHYTGISANVVFRDGVGETSDPHLIEWFKSKGYTVEGEEEKAEPELESDSGVEEPEEPEEQEDAEADKDSEEDNEGSK